MVSVHTGMCNCSPYQTCGFVSTATQVRCRRTPCVRSYAGSAAVIGSCRNTDAAHSMLWEWLTSIRNGRSSGINILPALQKPVVDKQQQQQQQQQTQSAAGGVAGQHADKEYCLRMAFKLTPKYSSKLQARVRWLQVLRAAQKPSGGGWHLDFDADYMTPRRLQQLANIIDATFLSGSFAEVCAPTYVVQDDRLTAKEAGDCDPRLVRHSTAGFEPATNSVIFYRPCWRRGPSMRAPLQADGVYCTNKLTWLAHTMGHEMVHCIVHHACPETRGKQAYVRNHGHGPVFLQLNKHIFGHDTARYRPGWSRLRPHLTVQPLQVNYSVDQQASDSDSDSD